MTPEALLAAITHACRSARADGYRPRAIHLGPQAYRTLAALVPEEGRRGTMRLRGLAVYGRDDLDLDGVRIEAVDGVVR